MIPHTVINEITGEITYELDSPSLTIFNYMDYPLNVTSDPPFLWKLYDSIWHLIPTLIAVFAVMILIHASSIMIVSKLLDEYY